MKKYLLYASLAVAFLGIGVAIRAHNRKPLAVPDGLAFSEFKGYREWQVIAISENGGLIAVILGNPLVIKAYRSGAPGNGHAFPDGSKIAKIHWSPTTQLREPGQPRIPGTLHDVDFMVKDSKRFSDSSGWGYGAFEYNAKSDTFRPADLSDQPPQGHDARCGAACHTLAKSQDFVFTSYPKR